MKMSCVGNGAGAEAAFCAGTAKLLVELETLKSVAHVTSESIDSGRFSERRFILGKGLLFGLAPGCGRDLN